MQASGQEENKDAKEQLLCGICCHKYEVGMREPVELPLCGHTFCRLCLLRLQELSRTFNCPACRRPHTEPPVDQLPVNFIVVHFLDASEKVEGETCRRQEEGGGSCSVHGDPLLLWCRQCHQALCVACLSHHHQHSGHTLLDLHAVLGEKKRRIMEQTSLILQCSAEDKRQVTREVERVAWELARLYERSEAAGQQAQKAENLRKIAESTNDVRTITNIESILSALPKVPRPSLSPTPVQRSGKDLRRCVSEDERSPTSDSTGLLTTARTARDQGGDCASPRWPLLRNVACGGRLWPNLPWLHFTTQIPAVQLVVPPPAPEVFLQLDAAGTELGRVHIRLWGQLRRAQHFLALCLGTFGSSYQGAKFRAVERQDEPGESLRGGDYLATDGSGSSCRGVMANLEWGGEYAGPVRKGLVGGGGGGCHESDSLFNICLRDKPQGKMSCPFGEVVSGLGVVGRAARHKPLSDVTIIAAGLVLPEAASR